MLGVSPAVQVQVSHLTIHVTSLHIRRSSSVAYRDRLQRYYCHIIVMSLSCHCHVIVMSLSCHCHVIVMSLLCHVIVMSLQCHCYVIAMSLSCHCHCHVIVIALQLYFLIYK